MRRNLYILVLACALVTGSQAVFAETTPQTPVAPAAPATPAQLIDPSMVPAPSVLAALRFVTLASYPILETGLKLTDEQKPQVRALLEKAEARFKPLIRAQRNAGRAFVEALVSKTDEAQMVSLAQATTKADGDLIVEKVKTLNALRALLIDQQKSALNSMLERTTMMWKAAPSTPVPPPSPADTK